MILRQVNTTKKVTVEQYAYWCLLFCAAYQEVHWRGTIFQWLVITNYNVMQVTPTCKLTKLP